MLRKIWKYRRALACGAITLGVIQAYGLINFSNVAISFLTTLLSLLVTLVFGGSFNQFFQQTT